jgi:hypothetical protein
VTEDHWRSLSRIRNRGCGWLVERLELESALTPCAIPHGMVANAIASGAVCRGVDGFALQDAQAHYSRKARDSDSIRSGVSYGKDAGCGIAISAVPNGGECRVVRSECCHGCVTGCELLPSASMWRCARLPGQQPRRATPVGASPGSGMTFVLLVQADSAPFALSIASLPPPAYKAQGDGLP